MAHVLGINEATFDVDMPLSDFGMDSLMAVQLRNRVEADLPLKGSLEKLLGGQSAIELAAILVVNSGIPAYRRIRIAKKS